MDERRSICVVYRKHQIINVTQSELIRVIDEYIIGFRAERNKAILKDRFCKGYTYEELAEKHSLSVNQVKNIVSKGCDIVSRHVKVEV